MELAIKKFIKEKKARYGEDFYLDTNEKSDKFGNTYTEYVVFTSRLQEELQTKLLDYAREQSIKVTSVEKSSAINLFVQTSGLNLYTKRNSGIEFLADQPQVGERVRLMEVPKEDNTWVPVVIGHDFESQAPVELGWLQYHSQMLGNERPPITPNLKGFDELFLQFLREYESTPYLLGGKTKELGIDCSGFVQRFFQTKDQIILPRLARWIALIGDVVEQSSITKGDLIFFDEHIKGVTHTGIVYEPNGDKLPTIIHSSAYNNGLKIEDLNHASWLDDSIKISHYRRLPTNGVAQK